RVKSAHPHGGRLQRFRVGLRRRGSAAGGAAPYTAPSASRVQLAGLIFPKSPSASSFGPAVKKSVFASPLLPELPNSSAHRPSIAILLPFSSRRAPSFLKSPFGCSVNAWILPLPKLPIRRSPPRLPQPAGASATPQGALR